MWWHRLVQLARLAVVLTAAGLTAGCFEPLYGNRPALGTDNVRDRLAAVELGHMPGSRLTVAMHNALQYELNGNAGATAPTHRLIVDVAPVDISFMLDNITGRPTAQIAGVTASFRLIEIATNKIVLKDTAYSHVDYDIAGTQQRFTQQRAELDAEDRAVKVVADAIRNRLASFFVAGT